VTSIGDYAFSGCTGLTNVTIPNSVTDIGQQAFNGCTGLKAIEVDALNLAYSSAEGVLFNKTQSDLIFYPAVKAGPYTIPNSVTKIGDYAFFGCSGLTSVTIPSSVTSIGDSAFHSCTGLTSVTIPNSVTSIGGGAFYGCTGLTSVAIPNSVAFIEPSAFEFCTGLANVAIPDSVTSIQERAFFGCTGLTSINLPTSLTAIGEYVFYRCTGLTSVTIPNRVTSIGEAAFSGCTGLTSVTIPDSVTGIGYGAFSGCSGLTSVTIPGGVSSMSDSVFYGCTGLTSVYFEGNAPKASFRDSAFVTVFYRAGATGWGRTFADRPTAVWLQRPAFGDWAVSTGLAARFPNANGEGDDPDGDGLTNGAEWLAGTDPTQGASLLELELTPRAADLSTSDQTPIEPGQHAVYFRSVPDRYYGVQRATSLGGAWELQATKVAATTQTRFVLPKPADLGFYRVLALP
jgi:hypothetical protein